MSTMPIILNPEQQEVVDHRGSPLVCFAAAGTGKTQALTSRIASLIKNDGIDPQKIIALTFTTKAAQEMKERAACLAEVSPSQLKYVSTFHSFCLKILRMFSHQPSFTHITGIHQKENEGFSIIDPRACLRIMTSIVQKNPQTIKNLEEANYFGPGISCMKEDEVAKLVLKCIEDWRNKGWHPNDVKKNVSLEWLNVVILYELYRAECSSMKTIDFSDLILYATRLLEYDEKLRLYCRSHLFEHLLIDEAQDTSLSQMQLIDVLVRSHQDARIQQKNRSAKPKLVENNLMIVGDDYQAIHEWRGAHVKNILDFETNFDNVRTIILKKNYRSFEPIIKVAENVIQNNKNQKHKSIECQRSCLSDQRSCLPDVLEAEKNDFNECIQIVACKDQWKEANRVVQEIKTYLQNLQNSENSPKSKPQYRNCAILYRNHALSQAIEEALRIENIPYMIKGSLSFFERAEVKMALSFLKLMCLDKNMSLTGQEVQGQYMDQDIEKVLVTCAPGIGPQTIQDLKKKYKTESLLLSLQKFLEIPPKRGKRLQEQYTSIKNIFDLIQTYREKKGVAQTLKSLMINVGYIEKLEKEQERAAKSNKNFTDNDPLGNFVDRLENLDAFFVFLQKKESEEMDSVECNCSTFLEHHFTNLIDAITLDGTNEDNDDNDDNEKANKVVLMTLHSSKGLEWPFVIIVGCDNEIIPYYKSTIEEERRLFYVGLTRARDKLLLTFPCIRLVFNKPKNKTPSLFIKEMKGENNFYNLQKN